jgi:hypothetical protein
MRAESAIEMTTLSISPAPFPETFDTAAQHNGRDTPEPPSMNWPEWPYVAHKHMNVRWRDALLRRRSDGSAWPPGSLHQGCVPRLIQAPD